MLRINIDLNIILISLKALGINENITMNNIIEF